MKTLTVARPLTWWQRTQIRGFWIFLAILIIICRKQISGIATWLIQKNQIRILNNEPNIQNHGKN